MYSCTFFGHSEVNYLPMRQKIQRIIADLIVNHNVMQFYCGYRGNFDKLCASLVWELKSEYPHIKNTIFLSYMPKENFELPPFFDDSVYLLEKQVPLRFAITYTNRLAADLADYILSGVNHNHGGAFAACRYARKRGKKIINIYE